MISIGPNKSQWRWEWLGRLDYERAQELQRLYELERASGKRCNTLMMLEHEPVLTLGRAARSSDILLPREILKSHHVPVVRCDRGGQVTYHGPGQLVGYLIVNIHELGLGVKKFVWLVEEGLRLWFAGIGIAVVRQCGRPGLWFKGAKIASLGFHVSRGITRHGFAMNLSPDLRCFDWIIPCGEKKPVTSVAEILARDIDVSEAAPSVADCLRQVLLDSASSGSACAKSESSSTLSSGAADSLSSS